MAARRKRGARDYAAEYARRQARARSKGYGSYYDYRAHGNGRRTPDAPRLAGEQLARVSGHRSFADLVDQLSEGSFVSVDRTGPRQPDGTYKWVDVQVLDEYGHSRVFRLRGAKLDRATLDLLVDEIEGAGAVLSPSPSMDIRQLHAPQAKVARFQVQALGPQLAVVVDADRRDQIIKRFQGRTAYQRAIDYALELNQEGGGYE